MKVVQLYKEVEITIKELKSNTSPPHKHSFFELIYVLEGRGTHLINDNNYIFSEGDVFLLTPDDAHNFTSVEPTRFCIIDFTKALFSRSRAKLEEKMEVSEFFKRVEYIFHNHHNVKGNIVSSKEKTSFHVLINQIIQEKEKKQQFSEIIIQNILFLLLHLIARNVQQNISNYHQQQNTGSKIHEITAYIQQHIYDKGLLKIENLAAHFHKSPDHLTKYFKTQTGTTIKEYVLKYKLDLVQTRLKFSDLTISEIAQELNFTDESHLNKVFKKEFGKTAKQFRREGNS